MDAALTALNHTESLRLHPRVDTTSANTSRRTLFTAPAINGRKMTSLGSRPAGVCIILSEYCNKTGKIIPNGSACWHIKWMSIAAL